MEALKRTLAKYFLSSDNTISLGALSIALVGTSIGFILIRELWPLSVDDLAKIIAGIASASGLLGAYRRTNK